MEHRKYNTTQHESILSSPRRLPTVVHQMIKCSNSDSNHESLLSNLPHKKLPGANTCILHFMILQCTSNYPKRY